MTRDPKADAVSGECQCKEINAPAAKFINIGCCSPCGYVNCWQTSLFHQICAHAGRSEGAFAASIVIVLPSDPPHAERNAKGSSRAPRPIKHAVDTKRGDWETSVSTRATPPALAETRRLCLTGLLSGFSVATLPLQEDKARSPSNAGFRKGGRDETSQAPRSSGAL